MFRVVLTEWMVYAFVFRFLATGLPGFMVSTVTVVSAQEEVCGEGTHWDGFTEVCVCTETRKEIFDPSFDHVVTIGCVYDTNIFHWSPDVIELTVQLLNKGKWGALTSHNHHPHQNNQNQNLILEYQLENSECKETVATRKYWKIRTDLQAMGKPPMHALLGARCSGESMSLARISSNENIPQLSPASNTARLSDSNEFPFFSRLVAPNNEFGEAGALVALLQGFGWNRITILETDKPFASTLAHDVGKIWLKADANNEVGHRGTIRTTPDDKILEEDIDLLLENVPTNNPTQNSRIIFLAAHSQHAFPILHRARTLNFMPDAIWVGISSWVGRSDYDDFGWLAGTIPGYLGVTLFRNDQDAVYQDFLAELQAFQEARGKPILKALPLFVAETVDAIRALAIALSSLPSPQSRRNGTAVVERLRTVEFDGVSGRVAFQSNGDRRNPQYSIFNAHGDTTDNGMIAWTDVGTVGIQAGSVKLPGGITSLCFAELGCQRTKVPGDIYPQPESRQLGIFMVIAGLGFVLILLGIKYYLSAKRLKAIGDTLAMRIAMKNCIPKKSNIQRHWQDVEAGSGWNLNSLNKNAVSSKCIKWIWMRKETKECISGYGDCWVPYSAEECKILEHAFQDDEEIELELSENCVIDFSRMIQRTSTTGIELDIQRVAESMTPTDTKGEEEEEEEEESEDGIVDINVKAVEPEQDGSTSKYFSASAARERYRHPTSMDLTHVAVSDELPTELNGEPLLVLVEGDVLQIKKQRDDSWAFGTKLFHQDEFKARELMSVVTAGMSPEEANISSDTGWFQISNTRLPNAEDLKNFCLNVGDAGVLKPPSHWDKVCDPRAVHRHSLPVGDHERTAVENTFLSTLRPPFFNKNVTIMKVERIQNLAMWQSYVVKLQTICHRERDQVLHEARTDEAFQRKTLERFQRRWLFHGTNVNSLEKILQQGFNRSFCGKNATRYGRGVYFARDACYSAKQSYSMPDKGGNQYMLACVVAVGEFCHGKRDALIPDMRDEKTHLLYDSTVGRSTDPLSNPTIFVTYHDAQAYPEYLVTFKTS